MTKSLREVLSGVLRIAVLSLLLLAPGALLADVTLNPEQERYNPGPELGIFLDAEGNLKPEAVLADPTRFVKPEESTPNLGFTDGAVWVRFVVRNQTDIQAWVLESAFSATAEMMLFIVRPDGRTERLEHNWVRPSGFRLPTLHFQLPPGETAVLYLRVRSGGGPVILDLSLFSEKAHTRTEWTRQFWFGMFYGLIAVMFFYNLVLFFWVRDLAYLYYVLTIGLLHGGFQLGINGYIYLFLPPSPPIIAQYLILSLHAGIVAGLLFGRSFLNLVAIAPRLARWFEGQVWIVLVLSCLSLFGLKVGMLSILVSFAAICSGIVAGVVAYRRGYRPARFFLIAWSLPFAGAVVFSLRNLGLLPATDFTAFALQGAAAIEAVLLSLALGDRINILRAEKDIFEDRLQTSEENEARASIELIGHRLMLDTVKDEILAIEPGANTLDRLLKTGLDVLYRLLDFEYAFIIVCDREGQVYKKRSGPMPSGFLAEILDDRILARILRIPVELFWEMNRIIRLDTGYERLFHNRPPANHQEMAAVLAETVERLRRFGFAIIIPLSHEKEIFGYAVAGPTADGHPYGEARIELLETVRFSLSLAVRNAVLYAEIGRLKNRAEEKANRLSDFVMDLSRVTRREIRERTLVFASQPMKAAYETARRLAGRTQPVLITGETGTGKELIAQVIHEEGKTAGSPFVAVNCAAIPASLWESEIFGHMKGAFTDATGDRPGRIEQAGEGTLFFDEIGEMPIEIQPKLLRLIQERKFQRLGGERVITAGCRFIFATNRDLLELQKKGLFRDDLFYRISVFQINLPPLRARGEDVPFLATHMLTKYAREMGVDVTDIDGRAMDALKKYTWPGNVRELENCMIQAVANCEKTIITVPDLPAHVATFVSSPNALVGAGPEGPTFLETNGADFDSLVRDYSRGLLVRAIERARGSKTEAARLLGLKRATFYYKLRELGAGDQHDRN